MASNGVLQIVPGRNDVGEHIFSAIVKRTYRFTAGGVAERCEADHPLRMIDEYYDDGDPEWSTVRHEAELAPFKPATDVVVIGKAYAPNSVPTQQMVVGVQIGSHTKTLIVTGDRRCVYREGDAPEFTDPTPFTQMEIRYERAYGGRDEKSLPDVPFVYPRNDMGIGVVLRNTRAAIEGLPIPNIEEPRDMLSPDRILIHEPARWPLQPLPQGLGWRQRTWYPRSALIGSYPPFLETGVVTPEEQMGMLPRDHIGLAKQSRLKPMIAPFGNGASIGMTFTDVRGDEVITLGGVSTESVLSFSLPGENPSVVLDIGLGEQQPATKLHTVSIRPDDREVDLIWRAAIVYEGYAWLPNMTRLHAEVQ